MVNLDPTLFCHMACMTELQRLELKRWENGVFRPLEGREQDLYDRLKVWYAQLGADKQINLQSFANSVANELMYTNGSVLLQ